jgi:hypothetical protein
LRRRPAHTLLNVRSDLVSVCQEHEFWEHEFWFRFANPGSRVQWSLSSGRASREPVGSPGTRGSSEARAGIQLFEKHRWLRSHVGCSRASVKLVQAHPNIDRQWLDALRREKQPIV